MKKEELRILSFQDARTVHSENAEYDRTEWIYIPDFYTGYRYVLGKVGKKPLITVGINPSTAEPENMDNTMKSVERITAGNGFDSFIMLNVYAQRATDPSNMDKEINMILHKENVKAFQWVLENCPEKPVIWAAWGTNIGKRKYLKECLADIIRISDSCNARWCRVGRCSVAGHPHHPLYLKKDSRIEEFDIKAYMDLL